MTLIGTADVKIYHSFNNCPPSFFTKFKNQEDSISIDVNDEALKHVGG